MSFSENTSDSDWKETKMKVTRHIKRATTSGKNSQNHSGCGKQKYSQKFCEKWLSLFDPWLMRSPEDPNKPFCRACVCRLDCNRCHLLRHERTTKHKRNLDALLTKGEGAVHTLLSVRQERSKYYHQRKRAQQMKTLKREEPEVEHVSAIEEPEPYEEIVAAAVNNNDEIVGNSNAQHFQIIHSEATNCPPSVETQTQLGTIPTFATENYEKTQPKPASTAPSSHSTVTSNQESFKLLMQIHQDKHELMESFRELMAGQLTPKEKNHVDLFFESVSSSVKALSPTLIAEAKMRVSQLICELELRGLKENNSTNVMVVSEGAGLPRTPPRGINTNTFILKQNPATAQGQSLVQHQTFGALS